MTTERNRFQALLRVQPGEGARVALMSLYSAAATGVVMTVGSALQDTLFLSALPPSDTAWLLILPASGIVLSVLVYGRIASRARLDRLVSGTAALLAVLFAASRVLLESPWSRSFGLLAAIYVVIDIGVTLALLQFWTIAGTVFNAREAKRVFGPIATGGTLTSMLAGLALGPLSKWIGVPNLLYVVVAGLGVCAVCAHALVRGGAAQPRAIGGGGAAEAERAGVADDLRAIRRSRLLSAIAWLSVILSVLSVVGVYQFSVGLQLTFGGNDQAMVAFLGRFESVTGLAALVIQLFFISRVLKRFGIFAAMLLFPISMALSSAAVIVTSGAFAALVLVRASEAVLRPSCSDAGLNVLYLPVRASLRERAIEFNEVLAALASAALGVGILAAQTAPGWSLVNWSWLAVLACGAWVGVQRWTKPQYQRALAGSLKKRTLDLDGARIDITDPATKQVLVDALYHHDEMYVLHALTLIAAAARIDWDQHVVRLLDHDSPQVRKAALAHLARPGNITCLGHLAAVLSAPEADVCAAAIGAYCVIAQQRARDRIGPFLADARPEIRGAAVTGLMRDAGPEGRAQAEAALDEMRLSGRPADRREAARAIGVLARPDADAGLVPLLNDGDPAVRGHAARAAGLRRSRSLLPYVLRLLRDPNAGREAADALTLYGPGVEPDLAAVLADGQTDRGVRVRIPGILRQIGTAAALDVLARQINDPDEHIRSAAGSALVRVQAGHRDHAVPRDVMRAALDTELRDAYGLYVLRHDLAAGTPDVLLDDTLSVRSSRALDRVFTLLRALYPDHKVERIRQGLDSGQAGRRANAIELLDNLAEHHVTELLIPLIEAPADEVLHLARSHFGIAPRAWQVRLRDLAGSPDPWLKACALFRNGVGMPLSTIERILFLKGMDLFSQVASEDLVPVAQVAQEVHVTAGEVFIRQGDVGDCVYLVVDGDVGITIHGIGEIVRRGPREAIGEMAIITRQPRSADCTALTDLTLLRLGYDDFWDLLTEKPPLALGVIRTLATRLAEAQVNFSRSSRQAGGG